MRLIFWFLLASNIGMLVLRYGVGVPVMFHAKEPARSSLDRNLVGVGPVALLGERLAGPEPELGLVPELESELDLDPEEDAVTPAASWGKAIRKKISCKAVGPFEAESIADSFVSRLAALDVSSRVQARQVSAGEGYWVYLEPQGNKKALRQQLLDIQGRGIDSYVIPRGKLEGGISLGMFSQLRLANKRLLELKQMGYEAKTQKIERTYNELWVVLGYEEDQKVGDSVWGMLLKGKNYLKEEENLCLDVDS